MQPSQHNLNAGFEVFERHAEYQIAQQERLKRAAEALNGAGLQYGIVGGQAVAAHVSTVDPEAVRTTRDIDMLVRRNELPLFKQVLAAAGFHYRHVAGLDMFLDGPDGRPTNGIHLVFAGEPVRSDSEFPAPEITEVVESLRGYKVVSLEALVRMKLTSYRLRDQVHLQDLLHVGLIDASWQDRYPAVLRQRLNRIIENPEM